METARTLQVSSPNKPVGKLQFWDNLQVSQLRHVHSPGLPAVAQLIIGQRTLTPDEQAGNTSTPFHQLLPKASLQELMGVRDFLFGGTALLHLQLEVAVWTSPQGFEELVLLAWALSRCVTLFAPGTYFEAPESHRSCQSCVSTKSEIGRAHV